VGCDSIDCTDEIQLGIGSTALDVHYFGSPRGSRQHEKRP
jgi:hypothetical protein